MRVCRDGERGLSHTRRGSPLWYLCIRVILALTKRGGAPYEADTCPVLDGVLC